MQKKRHLSLLAQASYVIITGLQLIFVPNMLLSLFEFGETYEIWIKVLGIVILPLAFVYVAISKSGNADVVRSTVWSRLFVGAGFTLLAISGQAPLSLILFGAIDVATAVWTWVELKKVNN
jgi:hypothetical protein